MEKRGHLKSDPQLLALRSKNTENDEILANAKQSYGVLCKYAFTMVFIIGSSALGMYLIDLDVDDTYKLIATDVVMSFLTIGLLH